MSYRDMRGSFYSAVRENETQSGPPSSEIRYVSFRLAFDNSDRIYRGGSSDSTALYAHTAGRAIRDSNFPGNLIGFRLTREEQ